MKIGFVGNENNIHFSFARYLRDEGFDADVMMFPTEPEHFHPSKDTNSDAYKDYCFPLSFGGGADLLSLKTDELSAVFKPYDVLLGTGFAPAYVERAGRRLDVFAPHGGDIASAVAFGLGIIKRPRSYYAEITYQRRGIGNTCVIHSDFHQPLYEKNIKRFAKSSERWRMPYPTIYHPTYASLEGRAPDNAIQKRFSDLRSEYDLVALAPCRHFWGTSPDNPGAKGTQSLWAGWQKFCQETPSVKKQLITVEYGPDVKRSKKRVVDLGLSDTVSWFPKLNRSDLMCGYFSSHVVLGEFVHSWLTGGVIFEALITNTPLITYRDETKETDAENLYEIYNAQTPEDIRTQLCKFWADHKERDAKGLNGRAWYIDNVVNPCIQTYCDYFRGKSFTKFW